MLLNHHFRAITSQCVVGTVYGVTHCFGLYFDVFFLLGVAGDVSEWGGRFPRLITVHK